MQTFNIKTGMTISGTYMGIPFTGEVTESRRDTVNTREGDMNIFIALDKPIEVLGSVRNDIFVGLVTTSGICRDDINESEFITRINLN